MERKTTINIVYAALALAGSLALQHWWQVSQRIEVIPYSEFVHKLESGEIAEVLVTERHIRGMLKEPLADGRKAFYTTRIDPDLARELARYDVEVRGGTEESFFKTLPSWVLPTALFVAVWMFLVRGVAERLAGACPRAAVSSARCPRACLWPGEV